VEDDLNSWKSKHWNSTLNDNQAHFSLILPQLVYILSKHSSIYSIIGEEEKDKKSP
jgi:hypothetical protein